MERVDYIEPNRRTCEVNKKLFLLSARHSLEQMAPSIGVCQESIGESVEPKRLYHCADGKKSSVGCLISPEHYRPSLECWEPDQQAIAEAIALSQNVTRHRIDREMIYKLWDIHYEYDPSEWEAELNKLSASRGYGPITPAQ